MAPQRAMIATAACILTAFSFGGAEAGLVVNQQASVSLTSTSSIKRKTLARGSTARNVAAAQYALAANRGFFTWWPNWGWRSFLGWWGRRFGRAELPAKLDDMVETTDARVDRTISHKPGTGGSLVVQQAMEATLDEAGYHATAATRDERAMISFMRRTTAKEGLAVVDEETLLDVVKFYDGECATQSYRNLVEELHRARHPYACHRAWTSESNTTEAATDDAQIAALVALSGAVITPSRKSGRAPASLGIGSSATLSEKGYQAVAEARDTSEMKVFIERVLQDLGLKVRDRSGLEHFAPYYSSECARQSFARLHTELQKAPQRPHSCGGGWVEPL